MYIIGQNLPKESIGSLHFQAFVVNEAFLTRLHRKKQLYRGYIYMFLLSTSTEHWKTIIRDSNIGLEVPNVRLSGDGQMALRALESARTDQEATADHLLVARFDAIGMLDEYENPKEKLIEMSCIFALLKETLVRHFTTFHGLAIKLFIHFLYTTIYMKLRVRKL